MCYHKLWLDSPFMFRACFIISAYQTSAGWGSCSSRDIVGGILHWDSARLRAMHICEKKSELQSTQERECCVENKIIAAHSSPAPSACAGIPLSPTVTLGICSPTPFQCTPCPSCPFMSHLSHHFFTLSVSYPITDLHLPYIITIELETHLKMRLCIPDS